MYRYNQAILTFIYRTPTSYHFRMFQMDAQEMEDTLTSDVSIIFLITNV